MISAAVMMLNHISERAAAKQISAALERVLRKQDCLTRDLGGVCTTKKFGAAVIKEMEH